MVKFCWSFVLLCFAINASFAHPADSAVNITSAKNSYQFVFNSRQDRIEVKEILNTVYTSSTAYIKLPVSEAYNDEVTIDDVSAKVDNRTPDAFKPTYTYYSENDIFYSDEKICYFPLVLSKNGSVAKVKFEETVNDPRYFTEIFFTTDLPVIEKEVKFIIPRWMKVELKELNFGQYNIKKTNVYDSGNDADIITYTARDLPAIKPESNCPGPTYIYPHILVLCKSASVKNKNFTYFNTVADQYAWYRSLVENINNNNIIISAKAKELTAGLNEDMDKIKAIFYYVQNNIRYIAFENGMAGFKPEKADEVLRKKYGDCKGMANLTKALLCSLGYNARLCWLGTDHIAYDYQTPSMAVDNHMICGLIYQGKTIYLDATETYLGINEYAERIQGRQVLMEDGEKYILNRVPVAAPSQNFDYETSNLTIQGNDLAGNVTHLWKGEDKEEVLTGLNSVKKEKLEDGMKRFLSNDNSDFVITDLKLSSTDNPDKDLTATYNLDHKNAVSVFSKAYYVDLDPEKELINSAIKIGERKNDYWFEHKMHLSKETKLALPPNYKVTAIPKPLNINSPDYEFHIEYSLTEDKLMYKKSILIKNTHLGTSKFEQWNKDIDQLAKTYNQNIILKPLSE